MLTLSSSDRVVNVQGGFGRGKSGALAPVTAIVKADGRNVIGLAVANKRANELGQETGAMVSTIARFLGRHARVIDGTAGPGQIEKAGAELAGAMIIVEEASQVGSVQMERLVRLADMKGVARLVQTGDKDQLGAIDQGKPFELSQKAGHATVHPSENLRSRSERMKAVVTALDRNDVPGVFGLLKRSMTEVQGTEVASTAAARWAALPKDQRENTRLLASGRAMRGAANVVAQAELKAAGEITGPGVRLDVLDRVNATREGARQTKGYQPGRVAEVDVEAHPVLGPLSRHFPFLVDAVVDYSRAMCRRAARSIRRCARSRRWRRSARWVMPCLRCGYTPNTRFASACRNRC